MKNKIAYFRSPTSSICEKHQAKRSHYCADCQEYQCSKCITDHSSHKIVYSDQVLVYWKQKETARLLEKDVEDLRQLKFTITTSLDKLIVKYETERAHLNNVISQASKQIDDCDTLLNIINDFYSNSQSMKGDLKKTIEKLHKDISEEITESINFISKTLTNFQQTKDYSDMLNDLSLTIHSFIPSSKKVIFYNIPNKKEFVINLNMDFDIPYYSDSLNINNTIFFIVGSENNEPCIVYELDKKNFSLIKKASLLTVKIAHSVIDNGDCIYSIGGWSLDNNCLNDCQKYIIAKEQFVYIPKMNEHKACPGLLFQGTNLYCIGGRTDEPKVCQIERLDTLREDKWDKIELKDDKKLWNPRSSPKCVALDSSRFFI